MDTVTTAQVVSLDPDAFGTTATYVYVEGRATFGHIDRRNLPPLILLPDNRLIKLYADGTWEDI